MDIKDIKTKKNFLEEWRKIDGLFGDEKWRKFKKRKKDYVRKKHWDLQELGQSKKFKHEIYYGGPTFGFFDPEKMYIEQIEGTYDVYKMTDGELQELQDSFNKYYGINTKVKKRHPKNYPKQYK